MPVLYTYENLQAGRRRCPRGSRREKVNGVNTNRCQTRQGTPGVQVDSAATLMLKKRYKLCAIRMRHLSVAHAFAMLLLTPEQRAEAQRRAVEYFSNLTVFDHEVNPPATRPRHEAPPPAAYDWGDPLGIDSDEE